MSVATPPPSRGLVPGFSALVVATFSLIVLGALVRANGAGLACPDWPLCAGELVPEFDLKVGFEWAHRALALGIVFGLGGLTVLCQRRGVLGRFQRLFLLAWLLLAVQIVLGGLTVILQLAPWTVTAHLLFGTGFCASLFWLLRDLAEGEVRRPRALLPPAVVALTAAALALLVLQLALGGMVSAHAAGLACAAFPTCDGELLAPTLSGPVGLHVIHRLNGYLIFFVLGALAIGARRTALAPLAWLAFHLAVLQIGVGALNVLLRLPVEVTGLHSALAAALALVTTGLAREAWYARSWRAEPAAAGVQAG